MRMLDRGRRRWGGNDPYDAAGRRAVLTVALLSSLMLMLVALRAGYLSARALGWPPWPVGLGCALAALTIPGGALWFLRRRG